MSDETAPDAKEEAQAPATKRPGSKRFSTTGGLAKGPSEEEQRRFRKKLLVWIIIAIAVLAAANVFMFVIRPMFAGKGGTAIDVAAEWEAAFDKAKEARVKIDKIEQKVWIAGETLSAADYKAVRAECDTLADAWEKISSLIQLVRDARGEDNKEMKDMVQRLYQIKFWVLDAGDLVDSEGKEGVDPGVFIPMNQALSRWQKAKEEFDEIVAKKDELLADPEQKKATLQRLDAISKANNEVREKLSALDLYICTELLNDDLSAKEVPELGPMRGDATLAGQAFDSIKRTRNEFRD